MTAALDELIFIRNFARDFCSHHYRSVLSFRSGVSFKILGTEPERTELRHLSTTATCIESLLDCPVELRGNVTELEAAEVLASDFAKNAATRPQEKWTSEGSAHIYCRCRALPLLLRHTSAVQDAAAMVRQHLAALFHQLDNDPEREAIGEADPNHEPKYWYPPNAFHTYWALEILDLSKPQVSDADSAALARRRRQLLQWSKQHLATQIALHAAKSAASDADQLAWALVTHARFSLKLASSLPEQDLMRKGLECLFERQEPSGTWRYHRPLFHYQTSGNAYCYVFETFTALLRTALGTHTVFLREELRRYLRNLYALATYANSTRLPMEESGVPLYGWSSGHRANQPEPEGWATASVYAFAQMFRRIVGIWTREEALRCVRRSGPLVPANTKAAQLLAERGDTWRRKGEPSVAEQLYTMFVYPVLVRNESGMQSLEPDHEVIANDEARSAILFGPPGTSKTTLASSVAGCLGWDYVEVHASDFLADGLAHVHRTADRIFRQLMELDHCVVLFDEIDELLRRRLSEPDASERFLTTSMLPKLAQLWRQRRLIYFVATNHLEEFDAAITRAQRFDALLFVPPTSFDRKIERLCELLGDSGRTLKSSQLSQAVFDQKFDEFAKYAEGAGWSPAVLQIPEELAKSRLPAEMALLKFVLLRWDQLPELASYLRADCAGGRFADITVDSFAHVLRRIGDRSLEAMDPYVRYIAGRIGERRDFGMVSVWAVDGPRPDVELTGIVENNGRRWLRITGQSQRPLELGGYVIKPLAGAPWRLCLEKPGQS